MEKLRFAGIVILAGVVAVGVSQGVEIFINRVLRPDATELTWIGDLVAAGGFMVMTTLVLKRARVDSQYGRGVACGAKSARSLASRVARC